MDSFNDLMKKLENTGSNNIDPEKVEKLATQLVGQGIANNMMEAREKAKAMLKTEKNVQKDTELKKESATNYNDPRNNPDYNHYKQANIAEFRKRALEGRPLLKVQTDFQTPGFEKKTKTQPTVQTFSRRSEQLSNISTVQPEIKPISVQKPIAPETKPMTSIQDNPIEPKSSEKKPEKKANMEIDLGSVFNFGNR